MEGQRARVALIACLILATLVMESAAAFSFARHGKCFLLCNTRKRKPSVCAARCLAKCVRPRFKATALKKVLKNVCQEEEVKRTVLMQLRSDAKTKARWPNRVPATSASMVALPICALKSALQKTLVAPLSFSIARFLFLLLFLFIMSLNIFLF